MKKITYILLVLSVCINSPSIAQNNASNGTTENVEPMKKGLKNSKIIKKQGSPVVCYWNGQPYSPGGRVCDYNQNIIYICQTDGSWFGWGNCR